MTAEGSEQEQPEIEVSIDELGNRLAVKLTDMRDEREMLVKERKTINDRVKALDVDIAKVERMLRPPTRRARKPKVDAPAATPEPTPAPTPPPPPAGAPAFQPE